MPNPRARTLQKWVRKELVSRVEGRYLEPWLSSNTDQIRISKILDNKKYKERFGYRQAFRLSKFDACLHRSLQPWVIGENVLNPYAQKKKRISLCTTLYDVAHNDASDTGDGEIREE